jgi:hypothetical protein
MRLSDLLGAKVFDESGSSLGAVVDVRAVQDGPVHPGFGAALRVDGLVVGRAALASRLGFNRLQVRGPWPLTALFRRLEGRSRYVEWQRVASRDGATLRIRGTGDDLAPPPPLPRRAPRQSSNT